ncbi:uncharacterized protein [Littorina saxatilis]|uniref:Uncharacterized protein n=1 Tax=Littorina saxatilis TaxID=31220 RepID=A0AAN9AY67_9CAEN
MYPRRTSGHGTPVFHQRTRGYQAGVALLFTSLTLFVIGFSTKYWFHLSGISEENGVFVSNFGLWEVCTSGTRPQKFVVCRYWSIARVSRWFSSVRMLECAGLINLAIACVTTYLVNFPYPETDGGGVRYSATAAGMVGLLGCAVFAVNSSGNGVLTRRAARAGVQCLEYRVDWSFYLTLIASVLAVLAAVMVRALNGPLAEEGNEITIATVATDSQGRSQSYSAVPAYERQRHLHVAYQAMAEPPPYSRIAPDDPPPPYNQNDPQPMTR